MKKVRRIGLLAFLVFLSIDSLGLASLAQTWLPVHFFKMNDRPSLFEKPVIEKMKNGSSLSSLFDYRSFRRIQASA